MSIKKIIRYIDENLLDQKIYINSLKLRNVLSKKSILSSDGIPVSLTSYGKRLDSVFYTIESIGKGDLLPSKIILWLDDKKRFDNLPTALLRLQKRGLEIRLTENYGPHTKYFPYVLAHHLDNQPLVTADDDIFYPKYWLKGLRDAYLANPAMINCYRAWSVGFNQDSSAIEPYNSWQTCKSSQPSYLNFATGVSGVIYPPAFLKHLHKAGDAFKSVCPKADDIWLHVNAIRAGYRVKQMNPQSSHFRIIPTTQDEGLFHANVGEGLNDQQIEKTYFPSDLEIMRKEKLHSSD